MHLKARQDAHAEHHQAINHYFNSLVFCNLVRHMYDHWDCTPGNCCNEYRPDVLEVVNDIRALEGHPLATFVLHATCKERSQKETRVTRPDVSRT